MRKVLAILCLAGVSAGDSPLFSARTTLDLTLKAPLKEVFQQRSDDDKFAAQAELGYRDPRTGADVVISGVELSVRGHTSRRGSECPFPKLKMAFGKKVGSRGESIFGALQGLRIGTHCGESEGEQLTPEFGRLANEKSPVREAFVYHLLDAMGVPTLRARPARIAYVDTSGGEQQPVVRNAVLLEDDDDVKRRVGATGEITMEQFTTARELFAPADTARLAFAQAMIGNFDWCLRFYPDDTYRCDAKQPLWNISAFKRADGARPPGHRGFRSCRHGRRQLTTGSTRSTSPGSFPRVPRSRSRFSARCSARARFSHGRSWTTRDGTFSRADRPLTTQSSRVCSSPRGRELAVQHLDAFFADLADAAFYRPVIARGTPVYVDAARTREACAAGDMAPAGTPVNVVGFRGRDGTGRATRCAVAVGATAAVRGGEERAGVDRQERDQRRLSGGGLQRQ